jgi:phytanoyl-CoA hydroxylase
VSSFPPHETHPHPDRTFRRHGYVAVPGFFNAAETAALQADISRLKRNGFLRNVATAGDGKTPATAKQNLQLCPANFYSTLIRALPFAPKVLEAVTHLIGDEVTLHLDQIFLKPGKTGMGTAWHQDNAYFKIPKPLRGTAMWIAIHDATVANGTMRVVPNAWNSALPHERDGNSDHHIRCFPDEAKAETIELKAGSVLFFCYGTPHCNRRQHHGHRTGRVRLPLSSATTRPTSPSTTGVASAIRGPG